eukprot:UN31186
MGDFTIALYESLAMRGELDEALLQFQLADDDMQAKEKNKPMDELQDKVVEEELLLNRFEIPGLRMKHMCDLKDWRDKLTDERANLKYLNNLKQGEINSMICPICQEKVSEKRVILECAHCFCRDCWGQFKKFSGSVFKKNCPLCRKRAKEP